MADRLTALELGTVTDETGRQLRGRRLRLGMSVRQLAERADVDRGRIAALEAGEPVRDTTLAKVQATLDQLEEETGMNDPEPRTETVEFTVEGDFGVKVTVKGPIADHALLRADVAEIIRSIRESTPPESV